MIVMVVMINAKRHRCALGSSGPFRMSAASYLAGGSRVSRRNEVRTSHRER